MDVIYSFILKNYIISDINIYEGVEMNTSYFDKPQFLAPLDNEPRKEDDFSILTDRTTIRSIVKSICNSLHHPATIFDINRIGTIATDKLRIDSEIEFFSLRNSCKLLRNCAGEGKCHKCDEFHAKMLKNYLDTKKLEYRDYPSFFYNSYINNPPCIKSTFSRAVLEYHCPMLGYRELLFPVFFENKLIAVLFLGQSIILNNDEDLIEKISNDFFSKEENNPSLIFNEYLQNNRDLNCDSSEIKNLILNADKAIGPLEKYLQRAANKANKANQFSMIFNTEQEYNAFISQACKEIEKIEKDILRIANKNREKYFKKKTKTIVENYFERLVKKNNSQQINKYRQRYDELIHAWEEFVKSLEELKKEFEINKIYVFGDGTSLNMEENREKQLFYPNNSDEKKNWSYNFSIFDSNEIRTHDYICSLDDHQIFSGLKITEDISNYILLVYSDIAILMLVKDLEKNKEIYKTMSESIGKDFIKIRFSIALCTANLMKERHVLTLRMNRHESSHVSTRLIDNMRRYFSQKGQVFLELDKEKQELVVDDMYNTIKLISHMSSNIGIITGSINYNTIKGQEKKLDVFDMLYKWQVMFRDKLADRNLDLIITRNNDYFGKTRQDAPRYIKVNPDLFELLVYNLVDNAVKYAYRGSTIYLSWHITSNGYKLTVSNFGPEIKNEERVYDLYTRGSESHKNAIDGDGIGLYVVKKIEKLLGIAVTHNCKKIADYYIPLIEWYLKESFTNVEPQRKKDELIKYLKGFNIEILRYILNNNQHTEISRRDLSQEYLNARIDRETWLTTFEVTIPQNMRW